MLALPILQPLPPGRERFRVVRSRHSDRHARKPRNVARNTQVILPAQHLRAGDLLPGERSADEVRHHPQILRQHLRLLAEEGEDALPLLSLPRLVGGNEERRGLVERPGVRPVQADHVIDAKDVVQFRRPFRTLAQPGIARAAHLLPARHRQSPILTLRRVRIGRDSDRGVEAEEALEAPDVRGILGHHERQIAEDLHALSVRLRPPRPPLRVGDPLHVAELVDGLAQAGSRFLERAGVAVAQSGFPVAPALAALVVQRAVERPILDPRAMLAPELAECALAIGAALTLAEPPEGAPQGGPLHPAVPFEVDASLLPQAPELRLLVGRESFEVGDGAQVDVDGLEREGARGGVGAVLAGGHFVQGKVLPERAARPEQPVRHPARVGVASQIARAAAQRGEGQEDAGPPPEVELVCHGPPFTRRGSDSKRRLRGSCRWDRAGACRRRPPPTTERSSTSPAAFACFP